MARKIVDRPEYVYENLEQLSQQLKEQNKTQMYVSQRLGVSNSLFANWVSGYTMPCRENYNKLAEFLGWRLW